MKKIRFKVIRCKKNLGYGKARRTAIKNTRNELVAIMDADDIALPERFEKELITHLKGNVSVVGGQITEFINDPINIIGMRMVPEKNKEIYQYLRKRCPFNQVTVMFKKSDVLAAGGYKDWYCNEDYYLWIRMAQKNMSFQNIPDILVNVRVGNDMYERRGGWKYFNSERKLQIYMLKNHIISIPRCCYNILIRFFAEIVATNSLRCKLYKFTRKKYNLTSINSLKDPKANSTSQNSSISLVYPPFSVAMSVYERDNAEWFDAALNSIITQTIPPDEIVLVIDGPISQPIEKIVDKYKRILKD